MEGPPGTKHAIVELSLATPWRGTRLRQKMKSRFEKVTPRAGLRTPISQTFYFLLRSSLDGFFPSPLDCIFRTLFQRDFPPWGCLPQSNLARFRNRLKPILVQKWVQVPSPNWGQNPSQKSGRKAYPNLGRPLRMRAGSHSERASQIWVRFSFLFWGRVSSPFWGRKLDPLLD